MIMNKNRYLFYFARLRVILLTLAVILSYGWEAQARALADAFVLGAWSKMPGNPVLSTGASGAWHDQYAFAPSVLLDGMTFKMWYAGSADYAAVLQVGPILKMWYSGYNGTNYQIGYASGTVPDHQGFIPNVSK
jgi:hypothetical protein